ncbi:MAG: efflux RND transporter permease subunit, partial [Gammaproteobacteria bacterium]
MLEAFFLVALVVFIFLQDWRSTLIPIIAVPVSLIGTFAFMQLLGFSLNIISLLALTLVVGFVVDDAIVVLENITRHLEQGEDRLNAALNGVKEIAFTVVSITLSLIVVFIPILFMGGILGKLFNEFAVTTVITILLSGVISLSLTPMLASRWLRVAKVSNDKLQSNTNDFKKNKYNVFLNKIFTLSEKTFDAMFNYYKVSLLWTLKHKKIILNTFLLTILFSLIFFKLISKGFITDQDVGNFIAFTEADADISFSLMVQRQKQVADIIRSHPDVENIIYNVGASGLSQTLNSGFIIVKLKPYNQRHRVNVIINQLRDKVNSISGMKVFLQNIPTIPIGAKMTKGVYQYVLLDPNIKKLQESVQLLQQKLELLPELQDVNNDLRMITPQIIVKVNR